MGHSAAIVAGWNFASLANPSQSGILSNRRLMSFGSLILIRAPGNYSVRAPPTVPNSTHPDPKSAPAPTALCLITKGPIIYTEFEAHFFQQSAAWRHLFLQMDGDRVAFDTNFTN